MTLSNEQLEKLSTLLMSADEKNAQVAFEIIKNNEFPESLISEIFAFFKTTNDKTLKNQAQLLLENHGSAELIETLKMRLPLKSGKSSMAATEKTIKKNIIQYTHNNELDGIKIAKALYKKMGVGATYLLSATPMAQRKEMLKTFISGTHFKLNNKALTQFPPELFNFPELTSIDLSQNKITSIPKNIEVFQSLKTLNLSQNKLKSIHKNFLKLENLRELNLSQNNFFRKFPDIIFKMPQLQKLNIDRVCGNYSLYQELPENIYNLKNLEEFQLVNSKVKFYSNYPSVGKVTGYPINLDPLIIAYDAYDQGDTSPLYYILKHGNEKRILDILNKYFDQTTQTMDLSSVHMEEIPKEIKQFKIKKLIMKDCGLGTYYGSYSHTTEILDRIKRRSLSKTAILNELIDLEFLDMSQNRLCEIADLSQMKKLKTLHLNRNSLGHFPLGLTGLHNLESLYMSNNYPVSTNKIVPKDFPNQIKQLSSLKKFQVSIQGMRNNKEYFMERLKTLLPHCDISIG